MSFKSRRGDDVMGASTPFSRRVVWETAVAAWRSPRLFAMALLAVAVILGAHYRFHRLDRWDMSNDEGTAWAGAIAPSVGAVIAAEPKIENGGKLPPYDVVLHGWIGMFGDAVPSIRRLSAVIGTIVVVLVFIAAPRANFPCCLRPSCCKYFFSCARNAAAPPQTTLARRSLPPR
jgi:hypothetical protein